MRQRSSQAPAWLLVTHREVLARITNKTFLIGTFVTVAMIFGGDSFGSDSLSSRSSCDEDTWGSRASCCGLLAMALIEVASDESLVQRKRISRPEITVAASIVRMFSLRETVVDG